MYTELIIGLLILSHVISDFYLQNDQIAKEKGKDKRIMRKHISHFTISGFVLTIVFFSFRLSLVIMTLSVLHLILDNAKIKLVKKYKQLSKLSYFIIDQILHVISILSIYPFIRDIVIQPWSSRIISYFKTNYPILENLTYSQLSYFVLASIFFLFLANGGTIITKLFLDLPSYLVNKQSNDGMGSKADSEMSGSHEAAAANPGRQISEDVPQGNKNIEQEKQLYRYGEVIGILERLIIFLLIISGHYEGITFVIAAKSIARLKQFDKDNFSDYYLVGTLASSLTAIIGAELFLLILHIL